jgi:hypothetical protein
MTAAAAAAAAARLLVCSDGVQLIFEDEAIREVARGTLPAAHDSGRLTDG